MKKLVIIMLFSLFIIQQPPAGDLNFETTAEGITNALTKPKAEQTIKTRSLKGFTETKTRFIKVVKKEQGKIIKKTLTIPEKQASQGVNLKIEFDVDSYRIRPESSKLLNELGKALTSEKLKEKTVIVKGHTDCDGDDAYNLKLSLNRANTVRQYLTVNFPITASRLKVVGYGEAMPLVPNSDETNKQINRRVEIEAVESP